MENEDEQRVKNRIDNRSYQVACHGIIRAAVRADQIGTADGDNEERKADGSDSCIGAGVGENVRGCTEKNHHGAQEELNGNAENDAENRQHGDSISNVGFCVFRFFPAHAEIKVCRAANAAEQADRGADHAERECHVGRRVSEHADAVADKELVYHVIEGADEHCDDARNGKAPQKHADRFRAEGIFGWIHKKAPFSKSIESSKCHLY